MSAHRHQVTIRLLFRVAPAAEATCKPSDALWVQLSYLQTRELVRSEEAYLRTTLELFAVLFVQFFSHPSRVANNGGLLIEDTLMNCQSVGSFLIMTPARATLEIF